MKNILIFVTVASIAIVATYYLIIENGSGSIDLSAFDDEELL